MNTKWPPTTLCIYIYARSDLHNGAMQNLRSYIRTHCFASGIIPAPQVTIFEYRDARH